MNSELIHRTQKYLFASESEMQEARLPTDVQQRLLRIRDIYTYWLKFPKTEERDIIQEIKSRYRVKDTMAYEDLRLIKICLGTLNQVTKDYDRYLFRQRCEEGFKMARELKDPNAFAKVLAAYGKYTQLDKSEADAPAYSDIVVQSFEITTDPSVLGFPIAKNWRDKAKQLEQKYLKETETIDYTDFEEIEQPRNNEK